MLPPVSLVLNLYLIIEVQPFYSTIGTTREFSEDRPLACGVPFLRISPPLRTIVVSADPQCCYQLLR